MKITTILFGLLALAVPALAQRESVLSPGVPSAIRYGLELGPALDMFAQSVAHSPIENPTSPLRALSSGAGVGFYGALFTEYSFAPKWSLQLRAGVEQKRFTMSGSGVADCPMAGGEQFDTVSMDVDAAVAALYLTGGIMLQFEPVDRLRVLAGPVLHRLASDVEQRVRAEITSPGTCVFDATGTKTFESTTSGREDFTGARWGIEAGVSYRIPVAARIDIVPSARFQLMLDPFSPDGAVEVDDFRRNTLGLLNLQMSDRTLHAAQLGVAVVWSP